MVSMPKPDSGWSWVIAGSTAYIYFALFGLFRSSGVMYVALLHTYKVTREEAAWPFSLCSAVFQLTGPLASILTYYLTLRKACLLGSAVATIGVACCYFADSILWINICYGIVHGLGFGVVVTLMPVILNQYFIRHRATAIGFSLSGGTVSSFIFPAAMEFLLDTYGLRGSFLILSGVVMNTMVACALLRAPPWLKKKKMNKTPNHEAVSDKNVQERFSEGRDSGVSVFMDCALPVKVSNSEESGLESEINCSQSEVKAEETVEVESEPLVTEKNKFIASEHYDTVQDSDLILTKDESTAFNGNAAMQVDRDSDFCSSPESKAFSDETLQCKAKAIKSKNLALLSNNNKFVIIPKKENGAISEETNRKNVGVLKRSNILQIVLSILSHPMFLLITFSVNIFFLGIHSFFMVIVDFAKDKGIPEDSAIYVLSVFSATDLLGRLCVGWVTDRGFIKRKTMMMISLSLIGVLDNLYPFANTLLEICIVCAFHGLAVGSSITLFFVFQAEYLGMKRLVLIVGLTSFINGITTFIRPGMIGLFRDVIGSYDWMFHFLGILSLITVVLWFAEPWLSRRGPIGESPTTACDRKC